MAEAAGRGSAPLPSERARGSGLRRITPARRGARLVAGTERATSRRRSATRGTGSGAADALPAGHRSATRHASSSTSCSRAVATSTTTSPTSSACPRRWSHVTRRGQCAARLRARPAPGHRSGAAQAGRATLREAIALAARVGGLLQQAQPHRRAGPRSSVNQMDIDDGDGSASSGSTAFEAVLNAMHARDSSGSGTPRRRRSVAITQERGARRRPWRLPRRPQAGASEAGRRGHAQSSLACLPQWWSSAAPRGSASAAAAASTRAGSARMPPRLRSRETKRPGARAAFCNAKHRGSWSPTLAHPTGKPNAAAVTRRCGAQQRQQ